MDATLALRRLLNPMQRASIPGLPRRVVVSGVWPDRFGFTARLAAPRDFGQIVAWARWRNGVEVWRHPEDPALSALPGLVEDGWTLVGHRLGLRATLGSPEDPATLMHLRPARSAQSVFDRWTATHAALGRAGVPTARLGEREPSLHGMRSERVRGEPLDGAPGPARMAALGETLVRAHAATPPPGLPARGPGMLLDAAVRQIGMAIHSGSALTLWLERRLERWRLLGAAPRHAGALVHGDFHLGRIAWLDHPVILDWDRAGPGDPEEDLGNLAAHLFWSRGREAAPEFTALRDAYERAGGRRDQTLFEYYARLSLVRLLSLRALSEPDQARLRSRQEQWAEWPEVVAGW